MTYTILGDPYRNYSILYTKTLLYIRPLYYEWLVEQNSKGVAPTRELLVEAAVDCLLGDILGDRSSLPAMADPIRRGATPEPGRGDGGTEDAAPEAAAAAPALEQNSDDRLDSACFALRPTVLEWLE